MKTAVMCIIMMLTACSAYAGSVSWVYDPDYGNTCITKYVTDDSGLVTRSTERYKRDADGSFVQCDLEITGSNTFRLNDHSVSAMPAMVSRIQEIDASDGNKVGSDTEVYVFPNTNVYRLQALYKDPNGTFYLRWTSGMLLDYGGKPIKVQSVTPTAIGYVIVFDPSEKLPRKLKAVSGDFFSHEGDDWVKE